MERRRPNHRLGVERGSQSEVSPASDDELRLREQNERGMREAVATVFADANQGEPT